MTSISDGQECSYCGDLSARLLRHYERALRFCEALSDIQDPEAKADGERMALVFMHAVFEDILRRIMRHRWSYGLIEWDELPLQLGAASRTKFSLLELGREYSGKTVVEVLDAAAERRFSMMSFNNADSVVRSIEMMKLECGPIRPFLPALEDGMSRRHAIVHEVDITPHGTTPEDIKYHEVARYIIAVNGTLLTILDQLHGRNRSVFDIPRFKKTIESHEATTGYKFTRHSE